MQDISYCLSPSCCCLSVKLSGYGKLSSLLLPWDSKAKTLCTRDKHALLSKCTHKMDYLTVVYIDFLPALEVLKSEP